MIYYSNHYSEHTFTIRRLLTMNTENHSTQPIITKGTHPIFTGNYTILTPELERFVSTALFWLTNWLTGAVVYGIARGGKTTAKDCLIKAIRNVLGNDTLIYSVDCSDSSRVNENVFFVDILGALNQPIKSRETALERRERVVSYLLDVAQQNNQKRIILFFEEAHNMRVLYYNLLMNIYNRLRDKGITLSVILIGPNELKDIMNNFIEEKKTHILGRFMVYDFNFKGIQNLEQLKQILSFYDEEHYPLGSECTYTQYFFPQAFDNGYRLVSDAEIISQTISRVAKISINSPNLNLPMLPITMTINNCFKEFGYEGECKLKPSEEDWEYAICISRYSDYIE